MPLEDDEFSGIIDKLGDEDEFDSNAFVLFQRNKVMFYFDDTEVVYHDLPSLAIAIKSLGVENLQASDGQSDPDLVNNEAGVWVTDSDNEEVRHFTDVLNTV